MLKRIAVLAACLACPKLATAAEEPARAPVASFATVAAPGAAKALESGPPMQAFLAKPAAPARGGRACEASGMDLCLDAEGRLTIPGAKRFLPEVPGLKPERLTVKRSGVVLGYSF